MLDSINSSGPEAALDTRSDVGTGEKEPAKSDAGMEEKEPAKSDAGMEGKEPAKRVYKTETGSSTPYDDAFRFLTTEVPVFLPPFYSYTFEEKVWPALNAQPEIRILDSAHPDASGKSTTYTDSLCEMLNAGSMSGLYHTEMESTTKQLHPTKDKGSDKTRPSLIESRLVGYYGRILSAHQDKLFNPAGESLQYNLAVLALRSNTDVPDELMIKLGGDGVRKTSERELSENVGVALDAQRPAKYTDSRAADRVQRKHRCKPYTVLPVPVIKVDQISVTELIAWRLYFLVPFHIVVYEGLLDKAFGVSGTNAEKKHQALAELELKLRSDYGRIWSALGEDVGFAPSAKYDLMRCTENVVRGMSDLRGWTCKDEIINLIFPAKEMGQMESYAKKIEQEGVTKGIAQGIAQGITKGIAQGIAQGRAEERTKANEAENEAVRNYVDRVRRHGMKDAAIIEEIEGIWGWSQEKARTAVLGAAT